MSRPYPLLLCAGIAIALPACARPSAQSPTSAAPASAPAKAATTAATETPVQAANQLFLAMRMDDFRTQTDKMAPALRALVEADLACFEAGGGTCEIDSDPWLEGGGQEGDIEGAPRFEVLSSGPLEARLRMAYTYAWDEKSKEPQTTCVLLSRATPDAPWQLADLTRRCEGKSFVDVLRAAFPNGKYP